MKTVAGLLATLAVLTSIYAQTVAGCATMCMGVKYQEASSLAPACSLTDISCFCSTPDFVGALQQCLSDNCATSAEADAGLNYFDQICAQTGVALSTFAAVNNPAASVSAALAVASVLGVGQSGASISAVPSASVSASLASQSIVSAMGVISSAYSRASASLSKESHAISASLSAVEAQASAVDSMLATQYSGASLASIEALVSKSLEGIESAAHGKYAADVSQAENSLASLSDALLPSGFMAAEGAVHSSGTTLFPQISLIFGLSLVAGVVFVGF